MRRWQDELAALRRSAPDQDKKWLSEHTKRCPQVRAAAACLALQPPAVCPTAAAACLPSPLPLLVAPALAAAPRGAAAGPWSPHPPHPLAVPPPPALCPPQCQAHTQKEGGCLHMTCSSCRHEYCWACGRAWAQHSVETGGFYHCTRSSVVGLPEYAGGREGGGGGGAAAAPPVNWLADVWAACR